MQHYHRLAVWRKSHLLALDVYRATQPIRDRTALGLISQLRRSALSIPATIAEGAARGSDRDFARFVGVSIASTTELEYHLEFGGDAGILSRRVSATLRRDVVTVRRMLVGLVKRLRDGSSSGGRRVHAEDQDASSGDDAGKRGKPSAESCLPRA